MSNMKSPPARLRILMIGAAFGGAIFLVSGSAKARLHVPAGFQDPQAASPQTQPQSQATSPQTSQPLRSATRLVELSVIVKDKDGNPVPDLTSADFVIRDEKNAQKLSFFRVDTSVPPANPPQPLPPDTYTNRPQDFGRVPPSVTMILFDGLNTAFADQANARAQVVKFLKQIRPEDHIALYALGRELKVVHDFTTDSARLVASITKSTPQTTGDLDASDADPGVQTGNDDVDSLLQAASQREANFYIQDRVHLTVDALTAIADHSGTLPGRKNLIWVSGSFPFSVGYDNVDDLLHNLNNPTNEQLVFADDIERAARALNDANIAVYPVDARGLMTLDMGTNKSTNRLPGQAPSGSGISTSNGNNGGSSVGGGGGGRSGAGGRNGAGGARSRPPTPSAANTRPASPIKSPDKTTFATMDTLAERTGGKAFYNTNDIFGAVRQAIDDSRLTYQIGYYPEDIKWNGSFREVKVEVKRPGVEVRTRKGYFALPDPKLTPASRRDALRMAATTPVEPTEMPASVHVTAADVPGARTVTLTVRFDPRAMQFQQADGKWTATLDTAFVQRGSDGEILGGIEDTVRMNLPDQKYQKALEDGLSYTKQVAVNPNVADVRVILRDAGTGKIGAVTVPLAKYFAPAAKSP
jgi:VWFA-related protein